MKVARFYCLLGVVLLAGCMSTPQNSIYQSSAPELRAERAISSTIELVSEVDLGASVLGVFLSSETYQDGEAQAILFTRREGATGGTPDIINYDLGEISSLSVTQAAKLTSAIDEYLAREPKSLAPTQMLNYELYTGTVDLAAGNAGFHPFKELTFVVVCSVTASGKSFKTRLPGSYTSLSGVRTATDDTFDLSDQQVKELGGAIKTALAKATPVISPATVGGRG